MLRLPSSSRFAPAPAAPRWVVDLRDSLICRATNAAVRSAAARARAAPAGTRPWCGRVARQLDAPRMDDEQLAPLRSTARLMCRSSIGAASLGSMPTSTIRSLLAMSGWRAGRSVAPDGGAIGEVHVVGAHQRPKELLEQIRGLVADAGRGDAADALRAAASLAIASSASTSLPTPRPRSPGAARRRRAPAAWPAAPRDRRTGAGSGLCRRSTRR